MIGIDTASIARIKKAIDSDAFLRRVFTAAEREYCDGKACPEASYAGLFCAKEATVKAVGCGFGRGVMPIDIEVTHAESGAPRLIFHGSARELGEKYIADLSISHDGDYAVAVVQLSEKQ